MTQSWLARSSGDCGAPLDGDVMPAQFKPEHIIKSDVQGLLKKVSVRPNHEYTDVYPRKMPAKITIRLQDGKVIEHEVQDNPGLASHPFTWEDSVEKFDRLVAGRVEEGLSGEIKDAVRSLENIQVRDLTKLLSSVKAESAGHKVPPKHAPDNGQFHPRTSPSVADTTRSV
jgi:2-methylcitrate dehydratase